VRIIDTDEELGLCPTAPCDGRLTPNVATTVQITGHGGVPTSGVEAVVLNFTARNSKYDGWLWAYEAGEAQPSAWSMSLPQGRDASAMLVLPVSSLGRIEVKSTVEQYMRIDVLGYYETGASNGSVFEPAPEPKRVLDTRDATRTGVCDTVCDIIPTEGTLVVSIAGQQGIPADATAVVLTATKLYGSGGGYFTLYPEGTRPDARQLSWDSPVVSNTTIVPVGSDGKIRIYSSRAAEVSLDVTGWFTNEPAPQEWTYTYAGDGLRRTKTGPDGTTTTFTWDRNNGLPLMIAESIDAPGTDEDRIIRYVYGPTRSVLADITEPAGSAETLRWYHQDQLGSTIALTSDEGAVLATFAYGPFGEVTSSTGAASTAIGWAGEYRDDETGYIYLRARHYDPSTAQFLTRDPMSAVSRDPYGYVWNNPVNYVDPSGQIGIPVLAAIAVFEIGSTLWDAYDAYRTFSDDCSGSAARWFSGGAFLAGVLLPGGGYGSLDNAARAWPGSADEMDELLGFAGTRIPDGPMTAGRNKVVWEPSDHVRITYEQHPYDAQAPAWHRGPHWHLDTPKQPHKRWLPGEPIPGY
jgi:RHS repeat-associated protein